MWIRFANSHTGQRHSAAQQAGQMAASDYRQYPILLLHLLGRPQMENASASMMHIRT
jgi:hypothetical protein